MAITAFSEELRHIGRGSEITTMKRITAAMLALATIASIIIYRAEAEPRAPAPQAEEGCVGLNCWPQSFPIKHRPAHRPSVPPLW